jgi:tetratricopeptide (TPR) repeat protein
MSDEPEDLDQRIGELHEKAGEHLEACLFRSAYRVYGELKRLGKTEQRVIPYINAVFHQMDLAQSLLEPRVTRDNAVELIALLEDEERARQMQPDFPVAHYEAESAWMTACAYENLAEATGMLEGYNSEGMHQCITDGVEVCRRTGKLACVNCFREYAAQVYTAADDLDMALHHARVIAANTGPYPDRGDRRHLGARNESWLMLLQGQLDAAEASLQRSVSFCDGERVSIPLSSRLHALIELETVRLLAGKQDPAETTATLAAAAPPTLTLPPPQPLPPRVGEGSGVGGAGRLPVGERPDLELRWALGDAVRACVRGDHAAALSLLTDWDRRLSERHCLHDWFETRLRLIAVQRLAGHPEKAAALARPLEQRARKAHDWLTVRRLARLLDPAEAPSPLALLAPLPSGPFAGAAVRPALHAPQTEAAVETGPPSEAGEEAAPQEEGAEATPLEDFVGELAERLEAVEDEAEGSPEPDAILDELLALPPAEVTHPLDACRLLNFVRYLTGDGSRGEAVWAWAEAVAGPFVQHAAALSLLGVLGDVLRSTPNERLAELIPRERVEGLLRQSLDLDPDDVGSFARAGAYFLSEGNFGEAERCLARGFRLQRGNGYLAQRLAEVYNQTERPRDALAVLDLCLREGCDDPQIAWEAALAAFRLDQYDVMLTYLDRFEEMTEADVWASIYRATALLELGRPEEAGAALDEAEQRDPEKMLPVHILRGCAAAALGQPERYRELLGRVLAVRLAAVEYLTVSGLNQLFGRLWKASACLGEGDPLRAELRARVLQTGLAPDELFEEVRERGEEAEGLKYYRCLVRQPLDDAWADSPACLSEQEGWEAYRILWGVLAADEDEARRRVLEWQAQCYPLLARVEEVELEADGFTDRPGVVWQGGRWEDEGEAEG